MARPDVLIGNQIGVESTHGTGVTANKNLLDLSFMFDMNLQTKFSRAMGKKYITTGTKEREWSTGSYNADVPGYNSLAYILAGLFPITSGPTQIGVTGGYTWAFAPTTSADDAYKSYTVQAGDASAAEEVNNFSLLSMNVNFGEQDLSISGDAIGNIIDTAATLDSSPTDVAAIPLSISDLNWYSDTSYGAIGGTQWTDILSASLAFPAIRGTKFVQNSSYGGFKELVAIPVEGAELTITAEYNSQTRAFVDAQRVDSLPVRFIQSKFVGDNIGTSADYTWKNNYAVKLMACTPRRNVQGVYAYDMRYKLVHSSAMGGAFASTLINTVSAL
jgi:hypothetical protein